jgi:hypothetical protein
MANASASNSLEKELRERLTGDVRFDDMTRGLYSTDASDLDRRLVRIEPGVVLDHPIVLLRKQLRR